MAFREELELEPISSLRLRDLIVVHQYTIVRAAVAVMRSHSLGCALIIDPIGKPIGLFTEKSLLAVLMQGASLDRRPVWDYAERDFLSFRKSEPIARVWDAVKQQGVRFIVVTDDEDHPVGMTGQRGIAEYVSDCFPRQTVVQRLGSKPWMQQREGA